MDRYLPHSANTQCHSAVDLPVVLTGAGAAKPTLGEGDAAGAYFTITRGGTGDYTLTTKDKFLAVVAYDVTLAMGTPANTWTVMLYTPSQNTDNTWSFRIKTQNNATYAAGTAADLTSTMQLFVWLRFRNSAAKP